MWTFQSVTGAAAAPTGALPQDAGTDSRGTWRYGLCGCFERPLSCLSVFCCQSCTFGQSASIAAGGNAMLCMLVTAFFLVFGITGYALMYATTDEGAVVAGLIISILVSVVAFFLIFFVRRMVRQRNRIEGNECEDCCIAFFCGLCSTCQTLNQIPGPYPGFWSTYSTVDTDAPAVGEP